MQTKVQQLYLNLLISTSQMTNRHLGICCFCCCWSTLTFLHLLNVFIDSIVGWCSQMELTWINGCQLRKTYACTSNTNKETEYDDNISSKRNDKTGVRLTCPVDSFPRNFCSSRSITFTARILCSVFSFPSTYRWLLGMYAEVIWRRQTKPNISHSWSHR